MIDQVDLDKPPHRTAPFQLARVRIRIEQRARLGVGPAAGSSFARPA
ncbi:hypothetical protein [Arthrobacter sp. H14-L1]|nr:hypothetical protein [Arthrobacter sp. H14-L1]